MRDFRGELAWWALIAGVALALGASVSVLDALALAEVIAGAVFAVLILRSPHARILATTGGALVVFQATSDTEKVVYLVLVGISLGVALVNLLVDGGEDIRAFKPMLVGAGILSVLLLASFFVSHSFRIAPADWFRDCLAYILLAALPLIGVEAARHVSRRWMAGLMLVLGVVAAVGFAVDWLERRGASTGLGRIVLASSTFCALAFIFATVRACNGPHRLRWFLGAAAIAAALLVTGTRTTVLVIAATMVGIAGRTSKGRVTPVRLVAFATLLGLLVAALVPVLADRFITEQGFLSARIALLTDSLNGRLSQDGSFIARANSYRLAQAEWREHPWFGGGFGHQYAAGLYSLDTPWMMPAKLGVVGCAALLLYVGTIVVSIRRVRTASIEYTSAGAFLLVAVMLSPFNAVPEDKGTALVVMMIAAMTACVAREAGHEGGGYARRSASGSDAVLAHQVPL